MSQRICRDSWRGRAAAHGRNIYQFAAFHFAQRRAARTANCALDLFGFWNRRAQAKGDIVGEVRAAKRKDRRVLHRAALVNDQPGRFRAHVYEGRAEFLVVFGQRSFRRRKLLQHHVSNYQIRPDSRR